MNPFKEVGSLVLATVVATSKDLSEVTLKAGKLWDRMNEELSKSDDYRIRNSTAAHLSSYLCGSKFDEWRSEEDRDYGIAKEAFPELKKLAIKFLTEEGTLTPI